MPAGVEVLHGIEACDASGVATAAIGGAGCPGRGRNTPRAGRVPEMPEH